MKDPLALGMYVLLIVPGFIFVQTRDYHLLRERKSDFIKVLEIVLWSAVIWVLATALPDWWMFTFGARGGTLHAIRGAVQAAKGTPPPSLVATLPREAGWYFLCVCVWTFVGANLWGLTRKFPGVDRLIRWVSARDWYPSVAFKFIKGHLGAPVVVASERNRYIGVLHSAPDTKEDNFVILAHASVLPEPDVARQADEAEIPRPQHLLGADELLIRLDDVYEIQAVTRDVLRQTAEPRDELPHEANVHAHGVPRSLREAANETAEAIARLIHDLRKLWFGR